MKILLVDVRGGVRPEKQNTQREYETMANEGQKMVAKQFKEDPDCSGTTKHSSRDIPVPPQEHISSCNI